MESEVKPTGDKNSLQSWRSPSPTDNKGQVSVSALNKDKDRELWEAEQKLKRIDDRRDATKISRGSQRPEQLSPQGAGPF